MLSGFYTAASGIMTQQKILNTLSNNLVNAKTPGFRAERVVTSAFEKEYQLRAENGKYLHIGKSAPIATVDNVLTDFSNSFLQETQRSLDVAISGNGFFNVMDKEGNQYLTRNGNFSLDNEGYLVTEEGNRVQGMKGEIKAQSADIIILQNGAVYSANGKPLDTLKITMPGAEDNSLRKFANGLFVTDNMETNVAPAEGVNVIQGALEYANLDLNKEYTMIMEVQRAFQASSTALKTIDQMNQKAVNQIASL